MSHLQSAALVEVRSNTSRLRDAAIRVVSAVLNQARSMGRRRAAILCVEQAQQLF